MHFSKTMGAAFAAFTLINPSLAGYTLEDDYSAENFFSMFSFFTSADPTHGFVQYVDQGTAQSQGLISTNASSVYMGVDSTNVAPNGRSSVRLTSNKAYNHGLIILDLEHMPVGCGTWPAFWTVGPNWPNSGEIDIIEGVNEQLNNAMTLHTGPNCGITNSNPFTGTIQTASCDVNAPNQAANAGCSIDASGSNTYGSGLNAIGGGVYATEWTSQAISVFFFPRGSIPADITAGAPNPAGWGEPLASFAGACNLDSSVMNQQIVFDTTFCGDWAGNVWSSGSCASQAATCDAFVANNPSAFSQAYWSVNSLQVYQDNGSVPPIVASTQQSSITLPAVTQATSSLVGVVSTLPLTVSTLAPIPNSPFEVSIVEPGQPAPTSVVAVVTPTSAPSQTQASGTFPFEVNSIQNDGFNVPGLSSTVAVPSAPGPSVTAAPLPSNTETIVGESGDDPVEVQSIGQKRGVPVIATTLLQASRTTFAPVIARNTAVSKRTSVEEETEHEKRDTKAGTEAKRMHARHLLGHRQRRHGNFFGL